MAICACAAAKQAGIPLEFSVFGRSFDVLSGIWGEFDEIFFFAEGWCASIRACASIRTYSVIQQSPSNMDNRDSPSAKYFFLIREVSFGEREV